MYVCVMCVSVNSSPTPTVMVTLTHTSHMYGLLPAQGAGIPGLDLDQESLNPTPALPGSTGFPTDVGTQNPTVKSLPGKSER